MLSLLVVLSTGAAHGDDTINESIYMGGLRAYTKRDYKTAIILFQRCRTYSSKEALVLLYLGHSYMAAGDRTKATQVYSELANKFPASPEAKIAIQGMGKIDPTQAKKHISNMPGTPAASRLGLLQRLIVVGPVAGHPSVSKETIETVKSAFRRLPSHYYKMLDDSGASISVAPNGSDRWPGTANDEMRGEGRVFGELPGCTYHRDNQGPDMYVFERSIIPGSSQLKEPYSQEFILSSALTQIGHGLDDLHRFSKNNEFLTQHQQDSLELSDQDNKLLGYFTTPMEACAEITGGIVGKNESDRTTAAVMRCFPRATKWLRNKLR